MNAFTLWLLAIVCIIGVVLLPVIIGLVIEALPIIIGVLVALWLYHSIL